ncbi:MAG: hypothetical protein JSV90_03335 [Methanobacteriota archaeon]|nr:MAG: hypothetical protein JSV90_03335 [Euryarchaeota archaeon]
MSQHVAQLPKQKAEDIGEFLTNNVSRAVVYALMHKQPMTRREIEKSPLTNSMRRLSLSAQTRELKDKSTIQMRTLLAKGVDCGVLVPLTSKRQNYYFLNSDLRIEPVPIRESAEDEEDVSLKVFADRSFAHAPGQAVLPSWGTAADSTILPVPYVDSPKSLVIWLGWMTTRTRRQILAYINENGPTKRPKLRGDLGFWADRIVAKEGLPSNVLERVDGRIKYQFSTFSFSKLKVKAEAEGKKRSWTSFPPSFWLTRTYEPLRCVSGASGYLDEGRLQKTPMAILEELAEGNPTINDRGRKDFLEVNFLERMSFYAVYHSGGEEATRISSESLVPEKVTFNSPEHPLVWISTTDEEHANARVDFRHEAAMMLRSKKSKEEQVEFLEEMLKRIARERIGVRLQEHEKLLTKDLDRLRVESYGLGSGSISAVADLELDRESLALEKKYFEKFMDILVPGAIEKAPQAEDGPGEDG